VERNLSGRESEARRAEALLEHELERFERWLGTLDAVPTIAALHGRGEAIARQVLAENSGRWESMTAADRTRLELMAGTIVRRLLHQPTMRLKASADEGGTYAYVQALRELFGLDTEKLSAFDAPQSERPAAAEDPDSPAAEVTSIRARRRHRNR
jgi:glutamyl-tRNA reductase